MDNARGGTNEWFNIPHVMPRYRIEVAKLRFYDLFSLGEVNSFVCRSLYKQQNERDAVNEIRFTIK